jgi:hypothetical protein
LGPATAQSWRTNVPITQGFGVTSPTAPGPMLSVRGPRTGTKKRIVLKRQTDHRRNRVLDSAAGASVDCWAQARARLKHRIKRVIATGVVHTGSEPALI